MTRRHGIPAPQEPIRLTRQPAFTAPRDIVIAALIVSIIAVLAVAAGVRP